MYGKMVTSRREGIIPKNRGRSPGADVPRLKAEEVISY
jgi:hypothetical protein